MTHNRLENLAGRIAAAIAAAILLTTTVLAVGGAGADAQSPFLTIDTPLDGATGVEFPVTVSGTIQNPANVTFANVIVSNSDDSYYEIFQKDLGFLIGFDGSWSLSAPPGVLPVSNLFIVEVYVEYANESFEQTASSFTAILADEEAPNVSTVTPPDGAVVTDAVIDVSAVVSDDGSGVDRVRTMVRKNLTGEYWSGDAWVSAWSWVLASDDGTGTWSIPDVDVSEPSEYRVLVWAWDVEGNRANWSDNPSPTFVVGSSDVTPPVVSSVFPADDEVVEGGEVDVSANVLDAESNVDRVRILVRNNSTGDYWDGFEWSSSWSWVLATDEDGEGTWSISNVDVNQPGSYRVLVWAWDDADNLATWSANPSPTFSVASSDSTPPEVLSVEPQDGQDILGGFVVDVSAVVTDAESGVDRVRMMVRRTADNHYWNGSDWVPVWSWVLATPDGLGDAWVVPEVTTEQPGTHTVLVWAWDEAGNFANWSENPLSQFQVNIIN